VSRHLKSTNSISNINIVDVIENESPPLLKEIRKRLVSKEMVSLSRPMLSMTLLTEIF
jgi:hypothetical protein